LAIIGVANAHEPGATTYKEPKTASSKSSSVPANSPEANNNASGDDKKKVEVRKTDTNCFILKLGDVVQNNVELMTGDPSLCDGCGALLAAGATFPTKDTWKCDFCGVVNKHMLDSEEMPKTSIQVRGFRN
jgi:hypothetical protein